MKSADLSEHSNIDTYYGKTETWDFSQSSEHNNTNIITSRHPLGLEEMDFASARVRLFAVYAIFGHS